MQHKLLNLYRQKYIERIHSHIQFWAASRIMCKFIYMNPIHIFFTYFSLRKTFFITMTREHWNSFLTLLFSLLIFENLPMVSSIASSRDNLISHDPIEKYTYQFRDLSESPKVSYAKQYNKLNEFH